MIADLLGCNWGTSHFLIFSDNVFGRLIYYSHLFPLVAALGLGIFVYAKNRFSLLAQLFFATTVCFSAWIFADLVLWAHEMPRQIMFFWSVTILLEPVIYILGLYFLMVYVRNGDITERTKAIFLVLLMPTIILAPTMFGILGFDYTNCDREVIEGPLVYYGYIVEIAIVFWTVIYAARAYGTVPNERKRPLALITIGLILFFLLFSWGNIVGTVSENWTLGQYGLFGMPILLAFTTYVIVKFKTFNIKLLSTQALVAALLIIMGSILFIRKIENVRIVLFPSLALSAVLGYFLTRSVRREVEEREQLQEIQPELYKRNLELAVKNKTLSLLGKLYEISILTLEPAPLAERITQSIKAELDFDLVGVFRYEREADELAPLHFAKSKRLADALGKAAKSFDGLTVSRASQSSLIGGIFSASAMAETDDDLAAVWDGLIPGEKLKAAKDEAHLHTVLFYPLTVEHRKVLGVLMIGLNRAYSELSEFEQESLHSVVNVIATALDKALLYEMLQITNKKLAESNEALKMLDTAKSEFISIASHQLRAPLTVIKGYVSMTLEESFGKVTEKTKGALLKVAVSAEQLIKLIGDMLNLSRIESGKIQYRFVEADLVAVAKGVIDEYRPEAKKRGLEILFDNKLPGEFLMKFDPDKIREVIINLVHNAIKYTPKGKITVELSQHAGTNDRVRLAVCDEGMGIKPGDISRLFTKFVRTDQAQISDPNGMGIGLYFVKRVAEDHGGRVWAESEGIGKGSTFAVELPHHAVVRPTKE